MNISPFWSTIISALFLLAGIVAVFTMLSLQGGRPVKNPLLYRRIHKVSGWLFTALFIIMFAFMLSRVEQYWEEASTRIAIHITLSVALVVLLWIKIHIPRTFPRLSKNLFAIGMTVYLLSFTLVGITAGYYILNRSSNVPYLSHADLPKHMIDEQLGKELFINKCSTCHVLGEIMQPRSVESWEKVVNEMIVLAEPRISVDQGAQILAYLSHTHTPSTMEVKTEGSILKKHCLPCHSATEVYQKQLSRQGWKEVVEQMTEYSAQIVPPEKTEEIVDYLIKSQAEHSQHEK